MATLTGIARKLVDVGLLDEKTANQIAELAVQKKLNFVRMAVFQKALSATAIAKVASVEFGIPYFDITAMDQEQIPSLQIKSDMIESSSALPIFQRGNRLYVAVADPSNLQVLEDIKFQTGTYPEPVIVEDDKLMSIATAVVTHGELSELADISDESLESLDISGGEELAEDETGVTKDDAPIVRFVNKMLLDAINTGVSDIHFEPYEKTYRVRFRLDGILREHARPPVNLGNRLATRLKVMAALDISEHRLPQDGRFKMRLTKQRSIDFRVSSCPTLYGEKIVTRILDPTTAQMGIDSLGYEPFQKEIFLRNIWKAQGMVLATGPTGSGKTVSLYTALNILNIPMHNISTVEDPVEINVPGINQVHVNVKAGLDFTTALRAFLRQDPDIIMVGEIRDLETAEIAIKAAQTGHMVLSTLHTNSAADVLTRLISMGIPSYNVATSVSLIIAQRLCRVLCPRCKKELVLPKPALLQLGFKEEEIDKKELTIFEAVGCHHCQDGYKGRTGIYELIEVSKEVGQIIMSGGNALDVAKQSITEGNWTLRESGLNKIRAGITTINEIMKITKD
ncbi:MAG TPA: type IV-A pilus assembly ATPase PilB [Gammaproteobacteria bacterium]|nr:type IV-A pilus assembly ATPase PilB [Gammaproteobacteria bacterium]